MLSQERGEIGSHEMVCGLCVRHRHQRGVQHVLLQRGDLPRAAKRLCPAFLPSPTVFYSSPSWGQHVSAVLNFPSELGSFILARAGACTSAIRCSCARGGDAAAGQCDHFSPSSSSRAKGFVPPYLHVSYISTPHLLVSALGHLSPLCEANGTPGKGISSSSTSLGFEHLLLAHTHMGSLYLTNNYLTKYANSIITVICLAIISV